MPRRKHEPLPEPPDDDDEELDDEDDFNPEELDALYELLDDFPELDEYLDDVLGYDDEDFYSED